MKHLAWIAPLFGIMLVLYITWDKGGAQCGAQITSTPYDTIVTAFDDERDAVLAQVEVRATCDNEGVTYYVAVYEGEEFIVYMSGVGPEAAAESTQKTLSAFTVNKLVFSGIAGALDPELGVGTTVVPRTWRDIHGGSVTVTQAYLDALNEWESVVVVDEGLTVDYFVTDTSTLPEEADVVDMETFFVATIAREHEVPFIAFRSVSDFADGNESGEGFSRAAEASAHNALSFIAHY